MYIRVEVSAKSKKENLEEIAENRYKISVKEPAERNMANKRVLEIMAQHFSKNPKELRIISGHHSPTKLISIRE